jgi:hypothetical protein
MNKAIFRLRGPSGSVHSSSYFVRKHQSPSSNPAPPLQNSMFSLKKRGFGDDSGDSLDDSPGAKAAHKTTQHLQAWTCMDRQESQRNWQEMRKTPGKPGFLSGEDRNRTFPHFSCVFLQADGKTILPTTLPTLPQTSHCGSRSGS